ncbi:19995_t:CDS:2 [Racocetra persica]|uniref:19995_t:CDS:1 n=1 Tax=Racocetra persica TaxID=160502 RepID=A0ACA9QLR4_9GLOM|nr:19995_t:CDS:2 [Racocetra persica]
MLDLKSFQEVADEVKRLNQALGKINDKAQLLPEFLTEIKKLNNFLAEFGKAFKALAGLLEKMVKKLGRSKSKEPELQPNYLKDSLTNFYKEHTEKFINNKADELREEAMAEIKSLRQIVAITLLAIFGLLALAYF